MATTMCPSLHSSKFRLPVHFHHVHVMYRAYVVLAHNCPYLLFIYELASPSAAFPFYIL